MQFETILSSRGNKLLLHGGFKYFLAHENKEGAVRWRCATKRCTSKMYTDRSHSAMLPHLGNVLNHDHDSDASPEGSGRRKTDQHDGEAKGNNKPRRLSLQCSDVSTTAAVSTPASPGRAAATLAGLWRGRKADMEVALPGPLALDCEDMFKEITKKLYGEDGALEFPDRAADHEEGSLLKPEDHITAFGLAALMQNGFPPPGILHANFQPKTNPAAEDKWTPSEESLQWTTSRIASYNPAQKLFKCIDCECVGFLSRVAEHWLGTHSNARVFQCPQCAYGSAWARCVRLHLVREHNMPDDRGTDSLVKNNPVLDEVTKYLQRLKVKIDSQNPAPSVGAAPAPASRPAPASPPPAAGASAAKRYSCPACPYATDRRDLYTRHENIHRDEKPFECYVCQKQFNRADHVKKHFLRMHRDHPYDLNRIRRQLSKSSPGNYYPKVLPDMSQNNPGPPEQSYSTRPQLPKSEHVKSEQDANSLAKTACAKKKGEKRYSCCYCPWSGVDNWCLKRHLNTHLKPFVCALCDYKAARSERLATHVTKVHNKKACGKCSFLAEDQAQLALHLQEQHHIENRNIKVPNTMLRPGYSATPTAPAVMPTFGSPNHGDLSGSRKLGTVSSWRAPCTIRAPRSQGSARLFNYMEASDGSDRDDPEGDVPGQDFLEAGDVGNAAEEIAGRTPKSRSAARVASVTSPAEVSKRSKKRKRKVTKNKKMYNKENKKSKFECNICSLSFKSQSILNDHLRQHSTTTLRSPLIISNDRASVHFLFDGQESKEKTYSTEEAWDIDENDRHSKRSRKQSQPKRIIQQENSISTDTSVVKQENQLSYDVHTSDNGIHVDSKPRTSASHTKVTAVPLPVSKQIDKIISKIVKIKVEQSSSETLFIKSEYSAIRSGPSIGDQIRLVLKPDHFHPLIKSEKTGSVTNLPSKKKFNSKRLIKKIRNRKSRQVVFRCKRCRLKFKRKSEIYLHYKFCNNNRNKQIC